MTLQPDTWEILARLQAAQLLSTQDAHKIIDALEKQGVTTDDTLIAIGREDPLVLLAILNQRLSLETDEASINDGSKLDFTRLRQNIVDERQAVALAWYHSTQSEQPSQLADLPRVQRGWDANIPLPAQLVGLVSDFLWATEQKTSW